MSESPTNLLLDVSRTVARARLPRPTGIDRVERAYIRWASAKGARFLAGFDGRQYLLDAATIGNMLGWIDEGDPRPARDLRGVLQVQRDADLRAAQSLVRRKAHVHAATSDLASMIADHFPSGGLYLNVGHDNLATALMSALGQAKMARAVLIHDTIPLDHPEYGRADGLSKFRKKLDAIREVELIVANSQHTASRLRHHGHTGTIVPAPLGIDVPHAKATPLGKTDAPPTFITLGTIEPRKNHALLLKIWQRFWLELGEQSPRLVIYGRRGWENREVFDQLDTLPMMGRTVIEAGTPDDATLLKAMRDATALLFPSLAEGYGLPLAEALATGTPVIASNLDALQEVGKDVPEYLAPTDEAAWTDAIHRYAIAGSPERSAQLHRLSNWHPPEWQTHFLTVENAMETILAQEGQDR